jgi:type IX secretion system PorP/SprF family membrane protein
VLKKINIFILTGLLWSSYLLAQQVPMINQYYIHPFVYNPAYTGLENTTNFFLLHRSQWTGIQGAPVTNLFTAEGALSPNKAGLGLSLLNDTRGIMTQNTLQASYSYAVKLSEKNFLRFGLNLGAAQYQIDYNKVIAQSLSDPFLFSQTQRKSVITSSAGILAKIAGLEIGIAVPQLLANRVAFTHVDNTSSYYQLARHYLGSLKYTINLSEEKGMSLAPIGLVRFAEGAPIQYDGNLLFTWKNKGWLAASYRSNYAAGASIGIHLNKSLSVGYAYDYILSSLSNYAGVSHELTFTYKINKPAPPPAPVKAVPDTIYVKQVIQTVPQQIDTTGTFKNLVKLVDLYFEQVEKQRASNAELEHIKGQLKNFNQQEVDSLIRLKERKNGLEPGSTKIDGSPTSELVKTSSSTEFKDDQGIRQTIQGYYIIAGAFLNKENAEREKQNCISKGYTLASTLYNENNHFTYVFVMKAASREEAIRLVELVRSQGITQAWIQLLK